MVRADGLSASSDGIMSPKTANGLPVMVDAVVTAERETVEMSNFISQPDVAGSSDEHEKSSSPADRGMIVCLRWSNIIIVGIKKICRRAADMVARGKSGKIISFTDAGPALAQVLHQKRFFVRVPALMESERLLYSEAGVST